MNFTQAILATEKNACFDCGRDLQNSTDWEPFLHRCYCGDFEQVAVCVQCMFAICEHTDQPAALPYAALPYAQYANAYVDYPLVIDTYIDNNIPRTHDDIPGGTIDADIG